MKAVVFDLDDTLYEERTYVRSGFRAAARELAGALDAPEQELFDLMWNVFEREGRGKVFDAAVARYRGKPVQRLVRRALSAYRLHEPDIVLADDADEVLERLNSEGVPVFIVTDGNKLVQARKIRALGLDRRVDGVYVTHRYGIRHAKPSPYCFLKIRDRVKADPREIVYIGDNPNKDFVGIKPLGFRTIRIMRGSWRSLALSAEYEAEEAICDLRDIFDVFHGWREDRHGACGVPG
jgi:putative hydrolase of the HAD superfamily